MIMSPKQVLDIVQNDQDLLQMYDRVEKYGTDEALFAHHGMSHILGVMQHAEPISELAELPKDERDAVQVACFMHDLGNSISRKDHAEFSHNLARDYFKDHGIDFELKDVVLDAIRGHSSGDFHYDSLIGPILYLSDKVDLGRDRMRWETNAIPDEYRCIYYIAYTEVKIVDNSLVLFINLYNDTDFDAAEKEISEMGFLKKTTFGLTKMAELLGKKPEIIYRFVG